MIVRHFLGWVRTAPAGERADATRALARAWLFSDLSRDDRAAAEGALLMLLDDPSSLVRQAMAETFARSYDAPALIVRALSCDQPSVALPILEYSPLLIDADLVDLVATGSESVQSAIARRTNLPVSVCAAIAEVGAVPACLALIENADAALAQISLDRIVERFGQIASIREALMANMDLSAPTRLMLATKLSQSLTQFVAGQQWLSDERAEQIADEANSRAIVTIAATTHGDDLGALVRHLRETGQLTAGLILRTLLSGNVDLFERALVELTGVSAARVGAILHERGGASLNALLTRAGFPQPTFSAFRAALDAVHEIGFVGTVDGAARLSRRMVERVLTRCAQDDEAESGPLLTLLRRFATESAREEARLFCDELVSSETSVPLRLAPYEERIAA